MQRHPQLLSLESAVAAAVDLQEPFLRGAWERDRVLALSRLLLRASGFLSVPVIATTQNAERMGGIVEEARAALPVHEAVIDKLCFSCAGSDAFLEALRQTGRRQVLLFGVETHICITQTALDMVALGYQVHVAADAVSSRSEAAHRIGLERMRAAGVVITCAESAVYEMLREAGTPVFRQVLELIKSP